MTFYENAQSGLGGDAIMSKSSQTDIRTPESHYHMYIPVELNCRK